MSKVIKIEEQNKENQVPAEETIHNEETPETKVPEQKKDLILAACDLAREHREKVLEKKAEKEAAKAEKKAAKDAKKSEKKAAKAEKSKDSVHLGAKLAGAALIGGALVSAGLKLAGSIQQFDQVPATCDGTIPETPDDILAAEPTTEPTVE